MPRLLAPALLCGALCLAAALPAQQPPPAPPPADAPPKGDLIKLPFAGSKVFPGTTRDVTIYVPKQYDGQTPACVHVHQDGVQYNAPAVFDRLIAEKKLPVIIGVFATPGRVPALDGKLALDRFNRSYEYDGLGPNYANFVIDELLPWVETQKTPDGRAIKLSKSGNDRSIGGGSSGAVCAFTAAWERPDQFSRVFSSIGTYVGLRGAQDYPTLVRKVEPKPLRVFLQDGSNDLNIYGGDWWMANQAMERSLTFAGYEVKHQWGDGGHDGKLATKLFPEAMQWLWAGWPAAVKAGTGSAPLREVVKEGEGWREVGGKYIYASGVAASGNNEVFFSDTQGVHKLTADGKVEMWSQTPELPTPLHPKRPGWREDNSKRLSFGPDGKLYSATDGSTFVKYDADRKPTPLDKYSGGDHLVVTHAKTIYYTVPSDRDRHDFNSIMGRSLRPFGVVCGRSLDGNSEDKGGYDQTAGHPTGVTTSPDQSLLYVADADSHWVYSYQIQPNGSLKNKQKFYHLHTPDDTEQSGAGGMCCDNDGRLYVATTLGVQVCDQAGRVNFILPLPSNAAARGVAITTGPEPTLVVTAGDKVFARKVKVAGALPSMPPTKPKPPRL